MKNLIGISSHVANTVIGVELGKAGVHAFVGELLQPREVLASAIGIMVFAGGAEVLFVRESKYWSVFCNQPVREEIREPSGICSGFKEWETGQRGCRVETQEELGVIVRTFINEFGDPRSVNPRKLVHDISWVQSLKPAPALKSLLDLPRIEIAALHALGGEYKSYVQMESCYEEAVSVAIEAFHEDSPEAYTSQVVLSNLYREEARRLKKLLVSPYLAPSEECCITDDLKRVQSKRVLVLHKIRRRKEAQSVKKECDEIKSITLRIRRATYPTCQLLRTAQAKDGLYVLYVRSYGEVGNFVYAWELFYQLASPDGQFGRRCCIDDGTPQKEIRDVVAQGLEAMRKTLIES
jgi:hypothetical protein